MLVHVPALSLAIAIVMVLGPAAVLTRVAVSSSSLLNSSSLFVSASTASSTSSFSALSLPLISSTFYACVTLYHRLCLSPCHLLSITFKLYHLLQNIDFRLDRILLGFVETRLNAYPKCRSLSPSWLFQDQPSSFYLKLALVMGRCVMKCIMPLTFCVILGIGNLFL